MKKIGYLTLKLSLLLLAGCAGYQPISQYSKITLPEPVYVNVNLSRVEPQHGVYIKDEINRVLLTRFHSQLTNHKNHSLSRVYVKSYKINTTPLTYDVDGLVTRYRVNTTVNFKLQTPKGILEKSISASEDASVKQSSLATSTAKESAIRASVRKAMDKFIAYIGKRGFLDK